MIALHDLRISIIIISSQLLPVLLHAQLSRPGDTLIADQGAERSEYLVPVVFHIIHYQGEENITDHQVHDALRILNEDLNRENPEWMSVHPQFLDLVADVGIEFRLAKLDPDGNCTNGITRTASHLTFTGGQPMRDLIQWPPDRFLNIWVHAIMQGATTGPPLPSDPPVMPADAELFPSADGVMISHQTLGSIGTSQPYHAHVLTHRVGHWLNLFHPWGGLEAPIPDDPLCDGEDDVLDTPLTTGSIWCDLDQNTCGSLDNVENFMEYSHCGKMFTHGQKDRMLQALNSPVAERNSLITAENHLLTGMDLPETPCKADFISDRRQVCASGSITFSDVSYHGITERWWNFPGGSPSTSTDSVSVIIYEQPGIFNVELTVTDGNDTLSATMNIEVLSLPGLPPPITEGFEDHEDMESHPWSLFDPGEDGGWEITTVASASGLQSAWLSNGPEDREKVDELISVPFDMTGVAHMNLSFRFAYASRTIVDSDRLRVYTSNDCGTTWEWRSSLSTFSLNTGGMTEADFVPSNDQWGYHEINTISYPELSDGVLIKFQFEHKGGNNIYLDDINIQGSEVGITDLAASWSGLRSIPNPTAGDAELVIQIETARRITIEIFDAVGRRLFLQRTEKLLPGVHRIDLPAASLKPGMYLVMVGQQDNSESLRLIVQ